MRQLRILGQGVWYEVRTRINNREPLFRRRKALAIFTKVFRQTMLRFAFTIRDISLEDDWLRFYIKPENGLELPDIMKWMKQVFAQRFNAAFGRIGHIWGDRYWSRILEGEPVAAAEGPPANGDRPRGSVGRVSACGSPNGDRPRGSVGRIRACGSVSGVRACGSPNGIRACGSVGRVSACGSPNGDRPRGSVSGVRSCGFPNGVRPRWGRQEESPCFFLTYPSLPAPAPG
ncbi:MAG: transposase [Treponema sp.]|jgi:REP element-mobilizing transposase RayT|nr:transposase [Treponema sp.]